MESQKSAFKTCGSVQLCTSNLDYLICFIADSGTVRRTFSSLDSMYPLRSESYFRQACRGQSHRLPCEPKILTVCLEQVMHDIYVHHDHFLMKQPQRNKLTTTSSMTMTRFRSRRCTSPRLSWMTQNGFQHASVVLAAWLSTSTPPPWRSAAPSFRFAAHLFG